MNLSLEVKRFMNNEHMGDYVSVVLPSELPVERAEVREVNRDKSAARGARSQAETKARAAQKARDRAENSARLRSMKSDELSEARSILDEIISQQNDMQPELDSKRAALEEAYADYNEKSNIFAVKKELFDAAESSYNSALSAERAAETVVNDCRATLSVKESSLASLKESGMKHEDRVSSAMGESAELKVISEKARQEANDAAALEAEKNIKFNELTNITAQLLAVMKSEQKKLNDAQRNQQNAAKEFVKASADHSSLAEALSNAEKAVMEGKGDPESLRAKAASQRAKLAAATTRLDNAGYMKLDAEKALSEAEAEASKAEIEFNRSNELLSVCRSELDELKARSSAALSRAAEAEAKYDSAAKGYFKSQEDMESNARDLKSGEASVVDGKKALLNAETDLNRRREESKKAREEMDNARSVMDENNLIMKRSEANYISRKTAFDGINSSYQMAEKDRKTQKSICDRLQSELRQLDSQLEIDMAARDSAVAEAENSEAEAERRRLSVRTINAKYETVKIHYLQKGKGEDLLLIHSVGQSLYTFRDLIDKLSSRFRVTAIDLVGFGYSQKPYYFDYSLNEMGDFIDHFMEAMGMEYAHLFGFSMGAGYVINFAKRYPDRVGKIVLLSPGGITAEMPNSVRMISNRFLGGLAVNLLSYRSVKKMLGECYFDLTNHTDDLCNEYYKPIASSDAKRVIRSCISYYDDEEVIHSLRSVNADTLLMWGNEDKWHPTEMADLFRAVMPKVNYTIIRNAGHLAHEEKAEKVAQLIKQFIPCGYDEQEEETSFV
ncbi:MAG: alpha/beta fold hydrolase [Clostridiales bacterium]|nr:alpha/beta fold hydrolase [Clostridiales bacterium]